MFGKVKTTAVIALCTVAAGVLAAGVANAHQGPFSGTAKIDVEGRAVNVSCSGGSARTKPVVVLMAGLGDGLDTMAPFQRTLSGTNRVCSYDRLGEGASDRPNGPQTVGSAGRVLTGVIREVAGDRPVVLVGHSLGGLIAARYAPDHRDTVKGLVLLDATSPTMVADVERVIPESATGLAAEVREQSVATFRGENPEQLVITDGRVRSAGDIPVEVVQHGQPYLAGVPDVGPGLERAWSDGQRAWLGVSCRGVLSTAAESGHYIHVDQPDVAVRAVQRVVSRAARG